MKTSKRLATVLLASALVSGGSVLAAAPAQAYTVVACSNVFTPRPAWQGGNHSGSMQYLRYSWYEKTFLGYLDGVRYFPGRYCV